MPEPGQAPAPDSQQPNPNPTDTPQAVNWQDHIPADLRGESFFQGFKDKPLGEVLKSANEAHKLVGASIRLPGEKDKPEERKAKMDGIYGKLGRPEKPEGYDAKMRMPEYIKPNLEFEKSLRDHSHSLGLSKDQHKGIVEHLSKFMTDNVPDPKKAADDGVRALMDAWGDAAFDRNYGLAMKTIAHFGGAKLQEKIANSGLANDPEVIQLFYKFGRELQESGVVNLPPDNAGSKEEILAKINAVLRDTKDLYWSNPGTTGRDERIREVQAWYQLMN